MPDQNSKQLKLETIEEGIRETLAMVLISPDFMYHVVATEDDLRQYELASRLSYFLWGSMPDEELFQLAAAGKLDDPQVIGQQVQRMLADPKAKALVENFAGQWLNLRNLDEINFDRRRFRTFNDELRSDMIEESAFIRAITRLRRGDQYLFNGKQVVESIKG